MHFGRVCAAAADALFNLSFPLFWVVLHIGRKNAHWHGICKKKPDHFLDRPSSPCKWLVKGGFYYLDLLNVVCTFDYTDSAIKESRLDSGACFVFFVSKQGDNWDNIWHISFLIDHEKLQRDSTLESIDASTTRPRLMISWCNTRVNCVDERGTEKSEISSTKISLPTATSAMLKMFFLSRSNKY